MRTSGVSRGEFTRPVGRRIIRGAIASSMCAAAVVAALGASVAFADEISSQPNEPAVVSPPQVASPSLESPSQEVIVVQSGEAPPASLEIPTATFSIPPAPAEATPAVAPEITAIPPPPAPVPDAPKAPAAVVELKPPPPPTPADILGLSGKEHAKERARHEKCLANAIYFEARGELLRGQVAVAQVVMNRVFSPYYPKDVCGVVYQNAERHLSCQFTFACDGRSKAITERGAWGRAQRIAKQTLDGKVWVAAVAKSTHYHAYWVSPSWVAEMKKMFRYGVHTFYRPHRWGDGSQEAGWVQPPVPSTGQSEIKAQPTSTAVKPVTDNQTKPMPASTQAKASSADNNAKPVPVSTQAKAPAADSKAKPLPATAQAKAPALESKAKLLPTNTQAKILPTNSQAKPAQKFSTQ